MIEKDNLFAFYDSLKRLALISFRNHMTEESLQDARDWLDKLRASDTPLLGVLCELRTVRKITQLAPLYQANLPFAFLILHPYQASIIKGFSPEGRYQIVTSYQEAFQFFDGALDATSLPSCYNSPTISLRYNWDTHIQHTMYYGIVNSAVTGEVYSAMNSNIARTGVAAVRGAIFDFRHVIDFDNSNLNSVRRTSSSINTNNDMSHIAVPLIVSTAFQERMVRVAMKVTAQEHRKQIVRSHAEALGFVESFQAKRAGEKNPEL